MAGLLSVGTPVLADGSVVIRSKDVTLAQEGILNGTVLNTAAQPVSGVEVHVLHGEAVVASTTSNEHGQFTVSGLRNGTHAVQVGNSLQPVRFWGQNAAPPISASEMAIVVDEQTVRGQMGIPGSSLVRGVSANAMPLLIFGGAVAIVLATTLDDNDTSAPSSP